MSEKFYPEDEKFLSLCHNCLEQYRNSPGKQKEVAMDLLASLRGEKNTIPYAMQYSYKPSDWVLSVLTKTGHYQMSQYFLESYRKGNDDMERVRHTARLEKRYLCKNTVFENLVVYENKNSPYALINNIELKIDGMYAYYRLNGLYGHDKTWSVALNPHIKRSSVRKAEPFYDHIDGVPVTHMTGLYRNCKHLVTIPDTIPETITFAEHAFDNTGITMFPNLPHNLISADYIFANCSASTYYGSTEEAMHFAKYEIPDSVLYTNHMFANNRNIRVSPSLGKYIHNANGMFAGNKYLEVLTNADALFDVDMFSDIVRGCPELNSVDYNVVMKASVAKIKHSLDFLF